MRNGNVLSFLCTVLSGLRSYRTYEEWKHRFEFRVVIGNLCSYRTYEEWKLQFLKQFHKFNQSSYRTYEEWKHHS